ncbi:MAG: hypothetical protein ISQ34_03795 [Rickettsiales bacterium]|nr:hypothetical protein [Rickettsiales bacterium]
MKAIDLRKKTIRNFTIASVLVLFLGIGILFNNKEKDILEQKLKAVKKETTQIDQKSQDLKSKQREIAKYIEIWKNLEENKKSLNGIDMDEVNSMVDSLAKKYYISSTDIKLGLPEPINTGIFNTKKIDVLYTKTIFDFKALDDASAMSFLDEFFNNIPGYYTISNVGITRKSTLSNQDLVSISKGKFPTIIEVNVQFFWYAFKSRDLIVRQADNKKSKRLIKF